MYHELLQASHPFWQVADFKALVEVEFNVPPAQQRLFVNGTELNDPQKSLRDYNLAQDDVLFVTGRPAAPSSG